MVCCLLGLLFNNNELKQSKDCLKAQGLEPRNYPSDIPIFHKQLVSRACLLSLFAMLAIQPSYIFLQLSSSYAFADEVTELNYDGQSKLGKIERIEEKSSEELERQKVDNQDLPKEDQTLTADQVRVTTPIYRPNFDGFSPRIGLYRYQVAWQGIPAAEATLRVERLGKFYKLIAGARTYSPISLLYNLKYRAEGLLSAVNLSPIRTLIRQRENSKEKSTEINFADDGQIEAVRWQNNGEPPKKLAFQPNNFTIDPFAAAFLARSLDWKMGEKREFDTFNGKSRYLITLTASGESQMEFNGEIRDVWEITPAVKNLTNNKANSKLRSATIYVTKDHLREVLLLRSKVFIGSVTTSLEEFAEDQPDRTLAWAADMVDMRAALR